jgi:hypothetical protein
MEEANVDISIDRRKHRTWVRTDVSYTLHLLHAWQEGLVHAFMIVTIISNLACITCMGGRACACFDEWSNLSMEIQIISKWIWIPKISSGFQHVVFVIPDI